TGCRRSSARTSTPTRSATGLQLSSSISFSWRRRSCLPRWSSRPRSRNESESSSGRPQAAGVRKPRVNRACLVLRQLSLVILPKLVGVRRDGAGTPSGVFGAAQSFACYLVVAALRCEPLGLGFLDQAEPVPDRQRAEA